MRKFIALLLWSAMSLCAFGQAKPIGVQAKEKLAQERHAAQVSEAKDELSYKATDEKRIAEIDKRLAELDALPKDNLKPLDEHPSIVEEAEAELAKDEFKAHVDEAKKLLTEKHSLSADIEKRVKRLKELDADANPREASGVATFSGNIIVGGAGTCCCNGWTTLVPMN